MREEYKQILQHMQKESKIKWYKQFGKRITVCKNGVHCEMSEQKNICHYYVMDDGIEFVNILDEAINASKIVEWLAGFERKIVNQSELRVLFGKKAYKFDEEKLINELQIICTDEDIEFQVYYECYEEDLILQSGLVEIREFQYAVVSIILEKIEVEKILLSDSLSLDQIQKEVYSGIQKYKEWKKYPLYDKKLFVQMEEISCVTTAEVASMLFHESVAHLAEADVYNKLRECDDVKIGNDVSIKDLTIRDYPISKEVKTNIFFDDMGVKTRTITIIEDGKFVGILSNSDEKMGKSYEVCGASRGSINNYELQIRMRNIKVENGTGDLEQLEKRMDFGLYIIEADNSYRKGTEIYLHVKKGFLIKQGCRSERVEDVWLMKKNRDFLKKIFLIGNNGEWSRMRKCNKNGGTIYISGFAPSIGCKMNITKLYN